MEQIIKKLEEAISDLKATVVDPEEKIFETSYSSLELPDIVKDIVDFLQPLLQPYEAAIFWYMFRHSIVSTGTQLTRVSVRKMQENVVTSSTTKGDVAYKTISDCLTSLREKGAIVLMGDPNRDGTPYKVCIPEEIEICRIRKQKQIDDSTSKMVVDEKTELDYYNIKENRIKIFERDSYKCVYCQKLLTRFSATIEHITPVSKGGTHSFDNLKTSCLHCNSERNNKDLSDYLAKK